MHADVLEMALDIQKLKGVDDEDLSKDSSLEHVSRRKTIHNIEKNLERKSQPVNDLQTAFKKRWTKLLGKTMQYIKNI